MDSDHDHSVRAGARARDDTLHRDLATLKHLNASLALFNDALRATHTAAGHVAAQLAHTDALLNKYVNVLAKSEAVAQLIFDDRWQGADADEDTLRDEALAQARRDKERVDREEAERMQAARIEAEERAAPPAHAPRGRAPSTSTRVRGVRPTRAAARGTKGIPRAASTSGSAIPRTRSASTTGSVASSASQRPASSASRGLGPSKKPHDHHKDFGQNSLVGKP